MKGRALLAWNLRRIRVAKGVSQERLALDAGVDRAYVSGIERETENPSVDIVDRLALTLGADVADLFRLPAEGEQKPDALRQGRKSNG